MKHIHLIAGLIALLALAMGLVLADGNAKSVESRSIHALAPRDFIQKHMGSALQREAFRAVDLLPLYGSSELAIHDPYHANTLFHNYPTGFTVFTVGMDATEPLNMLQKLAGAGSDLRGKRVAISLSPQFLLAPAENEADYRHNFSLLQAYELIFSADLPWNLKQAVAQRMLDYPKTLGNQQVLSWALELCANGSLTSEALYNFLWPVGKLQMLTLQLQDDWETILFIQDEQNLREPVRSPSVLDWPALQARAEQEYRTMANNNPFGIENDRWPALQEHVLAAKGTMDDQQFLHALETSTGWRDLDLMLQTLKELGARPLILCMPLDGAYYDWRGVSPAVRPAFYAKLETVVGTYGYPLVDFAGHDQDLYFLMSPESHLSSKGWTFYDEALNAFYHGQLDSTQ
ncbi:MAG: D-alanyl-lipoteichoic acid biosynthesis protein DltD [Anaerolineae bacterium]